MAEGKAVGEARAGLRSYRIVIVGALVVLATLAMSATLLPAAGRAACNPAPHVPIHIQSDRDFTAANGVVAGTGSPANPYVIANLQFKDVSVGYGLWVDNGSGKVTRSFAITCVQSSFKVAAPAGASLVWIVDIHAATRISQVTSNTGESPGSIGIRVDGSSRIWLDDESLNKYGGDGVQLNHSDHITITASKLKAHGNGLLIQDSHDITVGQACNLNSGNGCNEFTYDDDRGIRVEDSYNVLILDTITTADDSGGIFLDGPGTHNVTALDGIASGNGPICPSSGPTGYVSDTIAGISVGDGAYDITVHGYTINANGDGAGGFFDIMNGGNGLYMDPCTLVVTKLPSTTPPGGPNLDFNGNCWHFEFNFTPVPSSSC